MSNILQCTTFFCLLLRAVYPLCCMLENATSRMRRHQLATFRVVIVITVMLHLVGIRVLMVARLNTLFDLSLICRPRFWFRNARMFTALVFNGLPRTFCHYTSRGVTPSPALYVDGFDVCFMILVVCALCKPRRDFLGVTERICRVHGVAPLTMKDSLRAAGKHHKYRGYADSSKYVPRNEPVYTYHGKTGMQDVLYDEKRHSVTARDHRGHHIPCSLRYANAHDGV